MNTTTMSDREIADALRTKAATVDEIMALTERTREDVLAAARRGGFRQRHHASPADVARFRSDVGLLATRFGMSYRAISEEAGFKFHGTVASAMAETDNGRVGSVRRSTAFAVRLLVIRKTTEAEVLARESAKTGGSAPSAETVTVAGPDVDAFLQKLRFHLRGAMDVIDAGLANGLPMIVKSGLDPVRRHVDEALVIAFGGEGRRS